MLLPIHVRRCKEKTAKGNVYQNKEYAMRAAVSMRKSIVGGSKVRPFICPHCGLYHIGRKRKDKGK